MASSETVSVSAFVKENDSNFALSAIDHRQKEAVLEKCLQGLDATDSNDVTDCLSCVRILSRDEGCLDKLAHETIVTRLFHYAFPPDVNVDVKRTVEALKALSNLIFKRSNTIPHLRSLKIIDHLMERLKLFVSSMERNDVLLIDLKLLFILSGLEPDVRTELAKNMEAFTLFAQLLHSFRANPLPTSDVETICEALKGAYNIGYALQRDSARTQVQIEQFDDIVSSLREFLIRRTATPREHLQLVNQVVNFLNIVPKRCFRHLLLPATCPAPAAGDQPSENVSQMRAIDVLLDFLVHQLDAVRTKNGSQSELRPDETLCPVFNVFIKGAQGNRTIRKYCRLKILPYLGEEVRHLPEEGSTLRNRLCKLLTHPLQGVSELDALLLFVLCKEDIGRAVKYTGFGNFAGFLARHALLGSSSKKRSRKSINMTADQTAEPSSASATITTTTNATDDDSVDEYSSASSESDTEEYAKLRDQINPVTGRWELPHPNPMDGMSEEQKEYTAMELVNQIDRLQRSGLIQPGVVGEDGRVRPAEHVLELLGNAKADDAEQEQESDDA